MKRAFLLSLLATLLCASLFACPPPHPVPPSPDADAAPVPIVEASPSPEPAVDAPSGTPCYFACDALLRAGCPEGQDPACEVVLTKIDKGRRMIDPSIRGGTEDNHLTCLHLEAVQTPVDARMHGLACRIASTPKDSGR